MANRPFRVAFWALAINLGLSLCWLVSDPETARLALQASPPPHPDRDSLEPNPVLLADTAIRPNAETPSTAARSDHVAVDDESSSPGATQSSLPAIVAAPANTVAPETHNDSMAIADSDPVPPPVNRVHPETPPLPIREVSVNNEEGYPWALHDASRATFGTGKFEELPPPPEFLDDPEAAAATARSVESDHETATQLAGLGERLDELHGELMELRTSHAAVEHALTELAAQSETVTATTRAVTSPLEIRAIVMEAPLTGELRDGVLQALQQSGAAGEVFVNDDSQREIGWGVCRRGAGVVTAWLQRATSTGRMAQRTLHLTPGSSTQLDLWRLLPPRMVQARGSSVFERAARPAWGGALELRSSETDTGAIGLEFRSGGATDVGTASSSDGQVATIPDGGTLLITCRRDERGNRQVDGGGRTSPYEQLVGQSEIVVILSPRRDAGPRKPVSEPARLLPAVEAPELPASSEQELLHAE